MATPITKPNAQATTHISQLRIQRIRLLTPVFCIFRPVWYIGGMKVKTSITLSEDLVQTIDEYSDEFKNRSAFLETAAWAFIDQLQRAERDAQDIEIINRRAEYLNDEVMDALAYQVSL